MWRERKKESGHLTCVYVLFPEVGALAVDLNLDRSPDFSSEFRSPGTGVPKHENSCSKVQSSKVNAKDGIAHI